MAGKPVKDIKAKIMATIKVSGECWEWQGYRIDKGYGRLRHEGGKKLAHRVSYEAFVGAIPDGMCVLHKCDNPPCVNPDHLFLGTNLDNVKDCINKGRHKGVYNSPFVKGNKLNGRSK